jgi:LysM repeat protein
MTRETKIGLLVGLAFIIVIGILLSDHLTSSTEPPQAPLANAGNTVRSTVTTPGQPGPQLAPVTPNNPTPNQPVPTQNELTPGPNPVQIVKVGPGNSAPTNTSSTSLNQTQNPNAIVSISPASNPEPNAPQVTPLNNEQDQTVASNDAPTITKMPAAASPAPHTLDAVARQIGEELVALDANGRAIKTSGSSSAALRASGNAVEYKAEPGDTLSHIAAKIMGSSSRENIMAIVAANPSLKDNPDKIIVGRKYLIPTSASAASPGAAAAAPVNNPVVAPPTNAEIVTAQNQPRESAGEFWYTVKPGESLWRIANEQCGKPSAVAAIKELNKDILKGAERDQVLAGMKIRLPGKPVAQASGN